MAARHALWTALLLIAAGCSGGSPAAVPSPPLGAVAIQGEGSWEVNYDTTVERLTRRLEPAFGRLRLDDYRMPSNARWADSQASYERSLTGWSLDRELSGSHRNYDLRVYRRGEDRIAIAWLEPGTDDFQPIKILLVVTPR